MKKLLLSVTTLLLCGLTALAQEGYVYTDAAAFPVYGKAHSEEGPRYRRLPESLHMPHMTDCAVGGLDLYARIDGKWCFVGSGFEWGAIKADHQKKLVGNMEPAEREYMLYLALYDEVKSLELGVPEGYTLEQPAVESPVSDRPVVMYGTSILQGGCASRPAPSLTWASAATLSWTWKLQG